MRSLRTKGSPRRSCRSVSLTGFIRMEIDAVALVIVDRRLGPIDRGIVLLIGSIITRWFVLLIVLVIKEILVGVVDAFHDVPEAL